MAERIKIRSVDVAVSVQAGQLHNESEKKTLNGNILRGWIVLNSGRLKPRHLLRLSGLPQGIDVTEGGSGTKKVYLALYPDVIRSDRDGR